jgi:uncharacterized damage-inducible protein DinB
MKTCLLVLVPVLTLAVATSSFAQNADPHVKAFTIQFEAAKNYVTKSAEKVSEDLYSFKPTPEVRSFGAILAHIADGNYLFCSKVKGEESPSAMMAVEKGKTTKADIQKALAESYAYCDAAIAGVPAAQLADKADFFGMEQTKLSMIGFASVHSFEHYGNLVTYMRLKNIVPPSSEPRPTPTSGESTPGN